MAIKLFDSELKVMDVLWKEGDKTAKQISDILKEEIGWNMNTTYTVIKKCIAKGAIERSEPNFMCHALIAKEVVQEAEAEELIDELLNLENPYACPHGRPTIISMSRKELEKKFKRIV